MFFVFFFFFQAEDGIRDLYVTGVQTCALPILIPRVAAWHMVWPSAPGQLSFSIPTAIRNAGSPIRSAASACSSIEVKSGGDSKNCGAILHFSAHRIRVRVCVLREPAS